MIDKKNQNTTYTIWDRDYNIDKSTTNEEIEKSLSIHKPKDVQLQKNSYCKVVYRRH